jgi:hypothetical protein
MPDIDLRATQSDSPVDPEAYTEILPPKGNKKVGAKVIELLNEILEDKVNQGLHERWVRNYELGRNKHWRFDSQKVSLTGANLIYIHRTRTVNHLTDNDPTFNVRGIGNIQDDDREKLPILVHATEHWWNEQEQQSVFGDSVWNGETYGSAIEHVFFNPDLEYAIGEVETLTIDPFYFGLWPVRCRDTQKALACLYYQPMHIQEARRKWPKFAKQLKADGDIIDDMGDERREVAEGSGGSKKGIYGTISGVVKELLGFKKTSANQSENICLIVRCWVKDYSEKRMEDRINEATGEKEAVYEPLYTGNIRMVTVGNMGELVLEDEDNPSINPNLSKEDTRKCYLFDKFPFTKVNSLYETTAAWGTSDTEQLEQLNIEVNKALSQFNTVKDRRTRAKLINPQTSGVPNEHLTNFLGILNPTTANHGIQWLEPGQPLSQDDLLAINLFKDLFFLVAGSFELEQADTKGQNVIAYKAIAALLERAATMVRGKLRNYQKLVRERGRMYVSCMQNFYTEERWIAYTEQGEEKNAKVIGPELLIPAKISIVSGSTMPVSRIQEREEAIALGKMRMIDSEALLEKLGWSDWKPIVDRMKRGPIGELLQKLAFVLPQQVIQQIAAISQADIKDIKRAADQGKLQPIQLPKQGEGQGPEDMLKALEMKEKGLELSEMEANIKKILAEVEKIKAGSYLDVEKAVTEKVRQMVAAKGIEYDEEKLQIERAQVVDDIQDKEFQRKVGVVDRGLKHMQITRGGEKPGKQGPFLDKKLKSDNEDIQ